MLWMWWNEVNDFNEFWRSPILEHVRKFIYHRWWDRVVQLWVDALCTQYLHSTYALVLSSVLVPPSLATFPWTLVSEVRNLLLTCGKLKGLKLVQRSWAWGHSSYIWDFQTSCDMIPCANLRGLDLSSTRGRFQMVSRLVAACGCTLRGLETCICHGTHHVTDITLGWVFRGLVTTGTGLNLLDLWLPDDRFHTVSRFVEACGCTLRGLEACICCGTQRSGDLHQIQYQQSLVLKPEVLGHASDPVLRG